MKHTSNYRDLRILAGVLVFKLILEVLYIVFVQRLFAYTGFILAISAYKYLLGTFLTVLLYFVMPRDNQPASVILQIHLFLIFLPMMSYFALTDSSISFMLWSAVAFVLESSLVRLLPPIEVMRIQNSRFFLYGLIALLSAAVYFVMIRANGLSLAALNLDATYDIREGIRFPLGMGYFVPWQGKVVNPFLMALGYKKRNPLLLFLGVCLQLILFLITAQKAFLFIPAAIIGVMWFMRRTELLPAAGWIAPVGAGVILLQYLMTRSIYIPSLLIRRLLFLPAQLKFYWHEFFSQNPKLFYSQGSIGRILGLEDPYPLDAANLIGETFFGRPQMHANAGYVADAYANGGIAGMLIIAFVFSLILVLINSLGRALSSEFVIGLAMFHIISLNDGGLVTGLVTGGLLLLLILLFLCPPEEETKVAVLPLFGAPLKKPYRTGEQSQPGSSP